jgi:hypothetical protein
MKHLKHTFETLAKTHLKNTRNHCKHTQHPHKTLANICVKHMQHLEKHLQHTSKETNETLGTEACNIRVQPLQHMQHPDLYFQHQYETLATYI